jgi:hypothetical protein
VRCITIITTIADMDTAITDQTVIAVSVWRGIAAMYILIAQSILDRVIMISLLLILMRTLDIFLHLKCFLVKIVYRHIFLQEINSCVAIINLLLL